MSGRLGAALGACILVVAAGCGGSGGAQPSPLDRWRQQADAACDRAEKAIRAGGRPTDPDDLERLMVRVGDLVMTATDEIRALKVPEGEKARVAPVLEQVDAVRERVGAIREATESDDFHEVDREADTLRIDGSAYARAAEQAGLKRCGRRAITDALVDELMTPSFVASAAVSQARFDEQASRLRRFLAATPDPAARARLWEQMGGILERFQLDTTSLPLRLEKLEDRFAFSESDLVQAMDDAVFHHRAGSPAKARRAEQKAFKGFGSLRARTRAFLRASGPAGEEALERLDAEQRGKGGASSSGAPS